MATKRRKDSKGRVLRKGEYERRNGTYRYVHRDATGKEHSIYAPTLSALREKEDKVNYDILDGINLEGKKLRINDVYLVWKSAREKDVKAEILRANTFTNYCYMYEQFVMPTFGKMKVTDATSANVEAFYKTLIVERGLRLNSVTNVHVPLKQVFGLAVQSGYIRSNPTEGTMRKISVAFAKQRQGLASAERALTKEQQRLFLDYLATDEVSRRWYPIFAIMLNTGMRVGEVTGLRWCDVDIDGGFISVNHGLVHNCHGKQNGNPYSINATKTPAGNRVIPIFENVCELFREEKARQEADGIKCRVAVDGYTDFVFLNKEGHCLNQGTLNKALRRIIRDCNFKAMEGVEDLSKAVLLPQFSTHWLRHTFATRLVETGVNVKAAQKLLGHADISTTLNIYTDAQDDFVRNELGKLAMNASYQDLTNDLPKNLECPCEARVMWA